MQTLNENSGKLRNKSKLRDFVANQGLIIIFAVLIMIMVMIEPGIMSASNVISILTNVSIVGIVAVGLTYAIIEGNNDISVGSFLSFGNILPLMLFYKLGPGSEPVAILITLCAGVIFGLINGILVGFLNINAFMATLAMLSIWSGISQLCWEGNRYAAWLPAEGTLFSFIGRERIFGIVPTPVLIFLAVALIFGVVLKKTVFGRYVYAIGGNKKATRFVGVRDKWAVLYTYVIVGFTTAIAAVVWGARYMDVMTQQGEGLEMTAITGVILGGASLMGGTGSVFRTVIGVILVGFINNAVVALGLPFYYQYIATWFCIILAVWFDVAVKRRGQS